MRQRAVLLFICIMMLAFLASSVSCDSMHDNSSKQGTDMQAPALPPPITDQIPIHTIVFVSVAVPFVLISLLIACTRCGRNARASSVGHLLAKRPIFQSITGRLPSSLIVTLRNNAFFRWLFEWVSVPLYEMTLIEFLVYFLYAGVASSFFITGLLTHNRIARGRPIPAVAMAFGELAVFHLMLVTLPVTRILVSIFGLSFHRATRLHRYLGECLFLSVTVHGILMIVNRGFIQGDWLYLIKAIDDGVVVFAGILALLSLALLALFSLKPIRTKYFGLFLYAHYILGTAFLITAMVHSWQGILIYVAPSIAITVLDIILFRFLLASGTKLKHITQNESSKITALTIQFKNHKSLLQRLVMPGPGQFVYLSVPKLGLLSHPFSVASIDAESGIMMLYIKDMSSSSNKKNGTIQFTSKLRQLAKKVDAGEISARNISVWVQRPFGRLMPTPEAYGSVLLLAGGIGITPLLSTLQYYATQSKAKQLKSLELHWSVRSESTLEVFQQQLESILRTMTNEISFNIKVYISHTESNSHIQDEEETIGFAKERGSIEAATSLASLDPRFVVVHQRADLTQILHSFAKGNTEESLVGLYTCGPIRFVNQIDHAVLQHNARWTKLPRVQIHKEIFDV